MSRFKNNPSGQLWWVVFLLAIAVILPTVCLLWFMTQAVKNERLAIRQKLIDAYSSRSQDIFFKYPDNYWSSAEKNLNVFSALVIHDQNDKIYPPQINQNITVPDDNLPKIWKLEYSDKNYDEAIKQYDLIAKTSSSGQVKHECEIGIVRCLAKQGKFNEATKVCLELAYPSQYIKDKYTPELISKDRLMLVSLYSKTNHKDLSKELQKQFSDSAKLYIPNETKIFVLSQLIDLSKSSGLAEKLKTEIEYAQKIIDSALISVTAADYLENHSGLKSFPQGVFRKIECLQPLYGIHFKKIEDVQILGLLTVERMSQFWQKNADDFTDKLVFCRIYDNKGRQIAGEETANGEIFSTLNLKNYFTGWKIELYLRAGVFKEAADKKMLIYFWVAAVVIILMLASSILASKAVLKQAKLNKLKNDFIATISHELKTPLSSMRVLVDTLLEGRCESKQQETEYLQLISKENIRLSRMIDNFLTFSRMERNKQAFDFAPASPAEIAKAAAEAVQTKFNKENCKFTVTIDDYLPSITADKDAMVTVLVNLLDNAYKYSYDNKQIELNVFAEKELLRFAVKDNGIGMTRRQMKKIFDRFYQADTSLARRAEGTGLGLSIVKFIVDAHKGKIDVESKPGKGSIFTVTLPVIKT
jgi:signal transduction histidine kinase